jgi:hypothetical protein
MTPDQPPADDGPLRARAKRVARAEPPSVAAAGQEWRARAALALRRLAATLGVHPADVNVTPDPLRRCGLLSAREVLLSVADGRAVLRFIPAFGQTHPFLLLDACPACRQEVPVRRIACLADLGRHVLIADVQAAAQLPDAELFSTDPGHAASCPVRRPEPRLGEAYQPLR